MKTIVFSLSIFFLLLAGSAQAEKIDINTAPLGELVKITHIGEARARELISLRPFSSLDELIKIKGIGEARVRDIKKQGLAWVAEPEKPKTAEDKTAEDGSPQTIELSGGPGGSSLLFGAAVFTSFSGGVIIFLLKRKMHVGT